MVVVSPDFTPSIWTTIVVKYVSSDGSVEIKFNAYTETGSCPTALANRNVLSTFVGRGFSGQYANAAFAGFFAVDRSLSATETSDVVASMSRGESVLEACVACTAPTTSSQGSIGVASCRAPCLSNEQTTANSLACECKPGYTGQPAACVACDEGTYKFLPGAAACNICPLDHTSPITATSLTMCTFMCPAVTYKTVPRVDTVQTCGLIEMRFAQ